MYQYFLKSVHIFGLTLHFPFCYRTVGRLLGNSWSCWQLSLASRNGCTQLGSDSLWEKSSQQWVEEMNLPSLADWLIDTATPYMERRIQVGCSVSVRVTCPQPSSPTWNVNFRRSLDSGQRLQLFSTIITPAPGTEALSPKQSPCAPRVGMQISAATPEKSMRSLRKLKIELPYDPQSTSGYSSKRTEFGISKRQWHSHSIIHTSWGVETSSKSIHR